MVWPLHRKTTIVEHLEAVVALLQDGSGRINCAFSNESLESSKWIRSSVYLMNLCLLNLWLKYERLHPAEITCSPARWSLPLKLARHSAHHIQLANFHTGLRETYYSSCEESITYWGTGPLTYFLLMCPVMTMRSYYAVQPYEQVRTARFIMLGTHKPQSETTW